MRGHGPVLKATARRPIQNLPDALLRVADLMEPELARGFLTAVQGVRDSLALEDLAQAIIDGDVTAAEIAARVATIEDVINQDLPQVIKRAFLTAAEVAAEILDEELGNVGIRFDMADPNAVEYAEDEVGERITEVARDTVEAVRDIIRQSVGAEVGRVEPVIKELVDVIGLRSDQIEAVRAFRDALLIDGMDPVEAEIKATEFAHAQLKERAYLIARTEIMDALNAGAKESFRQAIRHGWIDAQDVNLIWIVTPDEKLCPICEELGDQTIPWGDAFDSSILNESIERPPAHPQCRCALMMVPLTAAQMAARRAQEDQEPQAAWHIPVVKISRTFKAHIPVLKYSPDQPRDPAGTPTGGQWTSGGGIAADDPNLEDGDWTILGGPRLYHGTTADRLDSILRNGLSTNKSGENYEFTPKGHVFVSKSQVSALRWATDQHPDAIVAILEIGIPGSRSADLDIDQGSPDEWTSDRQFQGDIPPEWIRHAWVSNAPMGQLPYHLTPGENPAAWRQVKSIQASVVAYVAVSLGAAPAKSHAPVAKYSDDQPRVPAGSPDGGQWTDGPALDLASGQRDATRETFYHGTAAAKLDQIMREGLRGEYSGTNWGKMVKQGHVYLATSLKHAQEWAESAIGQGNFANGAILEVRVPKEARSKLDIDMNMTLTDIGPQGEVGARISGGSVTFDGDIDPAWIVRAWKTTKPLRGGNEFYPSFQPDTLDYTWEQVKSAAETTFFIAILLSDDTPSDTTKGYPEFDPEQARDESGKWTAGGGTAAAESATEPLVYGERAAAKARQHVARFEEKVRDYDSEHAFAVSTYSGNVLLEKSDGQANTVGFTEQQVADLRIASGVIFVHNHPAGRSFSKEDIVFASKFNPVEVRVIGKTGWLYTMRSRFGDWPTPRDIREEHARADQSVYARFRKAIDDGTMTIAEAEAEHHHQVWTEVTKNLNSLIYERTRWKKEAPVAAAA